MSKKQQREMIDAIERMIVQKFGDRQLDINTARRALAKVAFSPACTWRRWANEPR
jgi:hypothetical protein